MADVAIGAIVVVAVVLVSLAIWLVPRWHVGGWRRAGITDEQKLAEMGVQARTSLTQAFGGLALICEARTFEVQTLNKQGSAHDDFDSFSKEQKLEVSVVLPAP